MYLFKRVADLQKYLGALKKKGKEIGMVPTMGALHSGHISLIEKARRETDAVVCSIFVNPTQFNDPADLEKYPRPIESDIERLESAGCNILFLPSAEEIYPPGLDTSVHFEFGDLDQALEGVFRPGHFKGMAEVVNRLLNIVQPDKLYMGQKDFQQFTIVRAMLEQKGAPIELVMCPVIREDNGVAMSSRNARLTPHDRTLAPLLYQTLRQADFMKERFTPEEIKKACSEKLNNTPGLKVEYFDLVDGRTLLPIESFADADFIVVTLAVWVGEVRLIDNVILKSVEAQSATAE